MSILRSHAFAILLIVALAGATAGLYPNLPDPVPTHWSLSGKPDGFMPKPWGAFVMPLAMMGVYLILFALPKVSPQGFSMDRFEETWGTVRGFIMVFLFFVGLIALLGAAGEPIPMDRALLVPMGLLLALLGNFMGKFTRNFFVGIRTPWTLASEDVWLRTHRLGGKVFVVVGLAVAVAGLLGVPFGVVLGGVVVAALIPIVYSYLIYRRLEGIKSGASTEGS